MVLKKNVCFVRKYIILKFQFSSIMLFTVYILKLLESTVKWRMFKYIYYFINPNNIC